MKHTLKILILFALLLAAACGTAGEQDIGSLEEEPEEDSSEAEEIIVIPSPGGTAIGCGDAQPPLITGFEIYQVPEFPLPEPRVPYRDPVFGTCQVRVTDTRNDLSDDISKGMKNEYSRAQSFNADSSLLLARSIEANWYLYDARTLQPLGRLPLYVEPRWDAVDPGVIYFSEETRLMRYDLRTGQITTLHEFTEDFPGQSLAGVWTRYEGSPSRDTRYWGLIAQDQDWQTVAFLVYDRVEDQVISKLPITSKLEVDAVTISPLGNYFLAGFDPCEQGQMGTMENPCGLMVYDRSLQTGRGLVRIFGHNDPALDAAGREVVVYQEIDQDQIAMLDLESGQVTMLAPIDFSHTPIGLHYSGRAFDKPGWILVSTYTGGHPTSYTWMDNQIFAMELKAGGRVVRLGHTRSIVNENMEHDYWAEPQASVSPDFRRVVFTSNWYHSGSEQVEMFMIILPENWDQ